jgi:predicted dehydrogenase
MDKSLRVVIVGCGSAGSRRAHALRALGVESLAFVDLDEERARRFADLLGGRIVTSAAVAAAQADAVIVCVPPRARVRAAATAVQAGAHVFVEAPLGDALAGASALVDAAAVRQRVLMVGAPLRFHPAVTRARSLLDGHALGRPYAVGLWVGTASADSRSGTRARDNGREGGIHVAAPWLDAIRWLFGQPLDVTAAEASIDPRSPNGHGACAAILRLACGALAQLYVDPLQGNGATRLEVLGTDGRLRWCAAEERLVLERCGGLDHAERVPADTDAVEEAEMRHFLACVLTGRMPLSDGGEGRATLGLMLAVQRASRLRRALSLGRRGRRGAAGRGLTPALRLVRVT